MGSKLAPQTLSYPERGKPCLLVGSGESGGKPIPCHIGLEHVEVQRCLRGGGAD